MATPKKFTDEEINLIKEYYANSDMNTMLQLIPRFGSKQINTKAMKMGIKKLPHVRGHYNGKVEIFTPEEIEIIKEHYPVTASHEEMLKLLPGKTRAQISMKAYHLGIRKHVSYKGNLIISNRNKAPYYEKFSEAENKIIADNYGIMFTSDLLELLPGRTARQVVGRASHMGIKKAADMHDRRKSQSRRRDQPADNGRFTTAETELFKSVYATASMEELKRLFPLRSETQLSRKAYNLRLYKTAEAVSHARRNAGAKPKPNRAKPAPKPKEAKDKSKTGPAPSLPKLKAQKQKTREDKDGPVLKSKRVDYTKMRMVKIDHKTYKYVPINQ